MALCKQALENEDHTHVVELAKMKRVDKCSNFALIIRMVRN